MTTPRPSAGPSAADPALVAALQAALAAHHAAVHGYGVLGARLPDEEAAPGAPLTVATARAARDALRVARDRLAAGLRLTARPGGAEGDAVVPVAPLADYGVEVGTVAQAQALVVRLEEGVAQVWRDVLPRTAPGDAWRDLAVSGLVAAATRATVARQALGTSPASVPLPGA